MEAVESDIIDLRFAPPSDNRLEVEVLSIDELRSRIPSNHQRQWLRAEFFRWYGVETGTTVPEVDFEPRPLAAGHWLMVNPGQVLRYDFSQPWTGHLVVFQREAVLEAQWARALQVPQSSLALLTAGAQWHLSSAQHGRQCQCVDQMREDMALGLPLAARNELLRWQLNASLLRMNAWCPQAVAEGREAASHNTYLRFMGLLEQCFMQHHAVAYYAQHLGVHERTLGRAVHAVRGPQVSAKDCVAQRIVLEAKRLLAHTQRSVVAIGLELGFDDPSNFAKFFRKHQGISPQGFRQTVAS